jgi:pentapeptide MXKDX repeat protein
MSWLELSALTVSQHLQGVLFSSSWCFLNGTVIAFVCRLGKGFPSNHWSFNMRTILQVFVAALVGLSLGLAVVGCTKSAAKNKDKMEGGNMGTMERDKMKTDKMQGGKMEGDKMKTDKMEGDKMEGDKMKKDKMEGDKMEGDKKKTDKMPADKMKDGKKVRT